MFKTKSLVVILDDGLEVSVPMNDPEGFTLATLSDAICNAVVTARLVKPKKGQRGGITDLHYEVGKELGISMQTVYRKTSGERPVNKRS